jgi:hypothetical protein
LRRKPSAESGGAEGLFENCKVVFAAKLQEEILKRNIFTTYSHFACLNEVIEIKS